QIDLFPLPELRLQARDKSRRDIIHRHSFLLERNGASPDLFFVGFFLRQRNIPLWRQPACANLLRFGEVGEFSRPSGECVVWPFFDLSIAVIFSVPSSDLAGRREPDLAVTLNVSDKLAEEMRAERSPARSEEHTSELQSRVD